MPRALWWLPAALLAAGCVDRQADLRAARAKVHATLADEAFGKGEYPRALAAAEFASQYDPLDPAHRDRVLRAELGTLLHADLNAERLARAGFLADAMEPADPPRAWLYQTARGFVAFSQGELVAAERHLTAAIKQQPNFVPAQVALGHVQLASKRPDEALKSFQAAAALNPNHAGALANVGKLLVEQGKAQDAVSPLTASLGLRDSNATRANLAEALAAAGMKVDAIVHLKRVVATEPRNAQAALRLATLLQQTGAFVEALKVFRQAEELGAGPEAIRGVAEVQLAQQDFTAAEASLTQALAAAPQDLTALFLTAEVNEKLKKPLVAATWYSNYLQLAAAVPEEASRVAIAKDRIARLPPAPRPH